MNISLVEVLEKISGCVKFIKKLATKKRTIISKSFGNFHHCREIASPSLIPKKDNLDVFIIPCIIGSSNFTKALCDMGARINLISLAIFKQLGLKTSRPIMT